MYGIPIGRLSRQRRDLVFEYTAEALQLGVGRPLLSVSMPTRSRAYRGALPHSFFDGLLPEGDSRRMIAYDFGLDEQDVFGLLDALGRDCAGALTLLPEGEPPEEGGAAEPITEEDAAERIRNLRFHPLGVDRRVRVSLAGMQEKLLLTRVAGSWALPIDGAPSTHIVKPAHPLLADSIANEALCMRAAAHMGIAVAPVAIHDFVDLTALVIERYDRSPAEGDPERTVRIHQEDFCQAHGLDAQRKYEERGGPSLRGCAELIRRWSHTDELERLLDLVSLNVLAGNADAHAKNLSLLHGVEGQVRLAPAYDVMSTLHYPSVDPTAGMYINGVRRLDRVTARDLIDEAVAWGTTRSSASARVEHLLERAGDAIQRAADELAAPDGVTEMLLRRARALSER